MGLPKEGIRLGKKASETHEPLGDTAQQAVSDQTRFLVVYGQAALCEGHRALGHVYQSKGESEKAIYYYEVALGIASFNWHDEQYWGHYNLAGLSLSKGRFDDAHAHLERAKSYTSNRTFFLDCPMEVEARV